MIPLPMGPVSHDASSSMRGRTNVEESIDERADPVAGAGVDDIVEALAEASAEPGRDVPQPRSRTASPALIHTHPRSRSHDRDAARRQAVGRFDAIRLAGLSMTPADTEVLRAIVALAVSIGCAAACGFGLGRGIGGAIAELGVRSAFDAPQTLGLGSDRNFVDQNTDHGLLQLAVIATVRWVGASICGAIGATLGSVVSPHLAARTGRQLSALPTAQLVPDHVADLLDGTGTPYGPEGVRRLRQEIQAAQERHGLIDGRTHVRAGEWAFGALNAVRGASLAMAPLGALPDVGLSAGVSLTAGALTGLAGGVAMARQRHRVPDAGHVGGDPAPLVQVPLFEVKKSSPVLPRFTGTGLRHAAGNIGLGVAHRLRLFLSSTWVLLGLGVLVNVAGAATRPAPINWIHRAGKAVELGVGVGCAVRPYFEGLPPINARERARLESQRISPAPGE
ncbi:hypothetical protein [Roseateles sp. L2-2]|uniref:hypothetical protein n=1 Tax=Roseateles sp. L2-2 TaxID=3422597 RepID=UPI003D35D1FB